MNNKNKFSIHPQPTANWPDMNEINSALDDFDSMLHEYENDSKENNNFRLVKSSKSQHKLSPSAVLSLVNNSNNKCDNTLKKRNALVAFEFKSLMDRVNNQNNQINEEIKLSDEISMLSSTAGLTFSHGGILLALF